MYIFFIKVQYSNGLSAFVTDDAVKGPLKVIHYNLYNIQAFYLTLHYILIYTFYLIKVGAIVDIKCSDKKELVRATIQKLQDCSQYTVGMFFLIIIFFYIFTYVIFSI